jgi:putative transmembrane protein PGPGW
MKVARVAGGFALLGVGVLLSLPGIPGPGIVVILAGLVLLSDRFVWARRALEWLRQKAAGVRRWSDRKGRA